MARYLPPTKCRNRSCRKEFKPTRSVQTCCSRECSTVVSRRKRAVARSSRARVQEDSNIRGLEGQQNSRSVSTWVAAVGSEGPPVVARSVTKAKPLSGVERAALAKAVPGLVEELPLTGRAAAIKNAVAVELGNNVFNDDPCQSVSVF